MIFSWYRICFLQVCLTSLSDLVVTFPSSLTRLKFDSFDRNGLSIDSLPSSITSLIFGYRFQQVLTPGILPGGLKRLEFNYYYEQPITDNVLPITLCELYLGHNYCKTIQVLPPNLQKLQCLCEACLNQKLRVAFG